MSCLYLDSCTSVMPLRWEIMQNNHSQSTWDIRMTSVWYLQGVAAGVLRGVGKQLIGALCNFVAFYFIGFPIGVSLMFAANMGIVGKTKLCVCYSVSEDLFSSFQELFFFFLIGDRTLDRTCHLPLTSDDILRHFFVQTWLEKGFRRCE